MTWWAVSLGVVFASGMAMFAWCDAAKVVSTALLIASIYGPRRVTTLGMFPPGFVSTRQDRS